MTFPMDSGKDCVRAWEMMPWVLQDTATQEQGAWLDSHLAQCEACRAEFAQQSRLRLALSLPADVPVDADAGLGRLLARLDTPDPQQAPLRPRAGNWLSRALVAAVLVQALGIGILGVKLWSVGGSPSYRTLSQETLPATPGTIRVVPDANMTLADWNALLHALRLQVVNGPNDVGAYTVAPVSPASTAQHVLQQLRTTRGILLAEPVAATP
ncbi:zf-HC2 domain-containing protein [Rhodanobacter denitrificans]|uniref:Zf-HC2 domain-containing protein n=1 Tax=Rhodanobacter denitrificans TaxID=666685 RepID=A0A368KLX5_9GAMM|nr:zf-HC2 domain-containing protein [Rhodanobacter denitrificans]RCS31693.1 zf-HC2 domain-containing protein [Rhodanobacter denitrificans]